MKYALLARKDAFDDKIVQQIENIIKENNGEVYMYTYTQNEELLFDINELKKLGYIVCEIQK